MKNSIKITVLIAFVTLFTAGLGNSKPPLRFYQHSQFKGWMYPINRAINNPDIGYIDVMIEDYYVWGGGNWGDDGSSGPTGGAGRREAWERHRVKNEISSLKLEKGWTVIVFNATGYAKGRGAAVIHGPARIKNLSKYRNYVVAPQGKKAWNDKISSFRLMKTKNYHKNYPNGI